MFSKREIEWVTDTSSLIFQDVYLYDEVLQKIISKVIDLESKSSLISSYCENPSIFVPKNINLRISAQSEFSFGTSKMKMKYKEYVWICTIPIHTIVFIQCFVVSILLLPYVKRNYLHKYSQNQEECMKLFVKFSS